MTKYASYILFLMITILVVTLYLNGFGPMSALQQSVDDFLCQATSPEGTRQNVVLVKIDGQAFDEFGPWPWNYDLIADLLAATAGGDPGAIAVTFQLVEDASQDSAGHTAVIAEQLGWIDNVILPYDIALASFRSGKTNNPDHLFNNSITVSNPLGLINETSTLQVRKVFMPAERILDSEPYLAFEYRKPDNDRLLRRQPLAMNYEGYYYPSMSLLTAAVYLGISTDQINVIENEKIDLGGLVDIPVNDRSEYYINFPREHAFVSYSAAQLLGDGFNYSVLNNKAVIICIDDPSYTEYINTPALDQIPNYVITASLVENFINRNIVLPSENQKALVLLVLFAIGGLCAYFLPQVSSLYRFIILFCGFIILANVNYFMVSSLGMLAQSAYVALELALFIIAAPLLESSLITGENPEEESKKKKKKLPRANVAGLDEFDIEDVPVRKIKESDHRPEDEKTTALEQPSDKLDKTSATIEPEAEEDFLDHQAISLEEEPEKTSALADVPTGPQPEIISPTSSASGSDQPVDTNDEAADTPSEVPEIDSGPIISPDSITNLGRYQILGTLGKGAMGHVYKGVDPAINRPVALKTIRLDFVNDPEEMEELKERLFREAQAAGKLSHPNIVTIYDVGSEGHLQYIAMEYLEGRTLEDMIKKKVKFNYKIIAQMIMQICSALDYAHERGIVHRDIKPANLMVLSNYQVKVMDYGIARVDSNSMTKTGIAMGTPNYISPEQLEGKTVDKRADLFSLGVVMYEMLLGRRPFKGENITSLIYAILNHDPEKPSTINPQIPLLFDHIVGRSLAKKADERYQKASEIATDLADFVDAFAAK